MKQTTNFLFKTMVAQTSRKFSFTAFKLPDLGYDYNGLEPVISAPLLEVHHKKHHQAYVNNYNASVEQLLSSVSDPVKTTTLTNAIKFNGGGAINHAIFWTNLSPISKNGGILPRIDSVLGQGIVKNWGSFEKFIEEFSRRALAVQVK